MLFNSVKEINGLRKERNRWLSKSMTNIYLKVTVNRKWRTQNFDFKSLKSLSSNQIFWELQLTQISLNFQTSCCNLKIRALGAKLCVAWYYFYFERNCDDLMSRSPCFLLEKTIKINKNETESKIVNPVHTFKEMNHVLQLA